MVNQAKLRSYRTAPKYQYGFEVPKDYYQHAIRLDEKAGNTKWQDSTKLEMAQLDNYDTLKDYGHSGKPPDGYKKIRVHLIFAVKHDWQHKSRLVADGHLTNVPIDSVYSRVVSLRGLRLLVTRNTKELVHERLLVTVILDSLSERTSSSSSSSSILSSSSSSTKE
jgi:hypothetical protein